MKACAIGITCLALAMPLHGQSASADAGAERAAVQAHVSRWRPLRVAKWSTAAFTTAAAIYGVRTNLHADELYDELERSCVAQPQICTLRDADGHYLDDGLEAQYQEVRRQDRRARNGLLASQVGVAATVVLFVLDLRNARAPADIPYEPPRLQVVPSRDGGVGIRYRVSAKRQAPSAK